MKILFWGTLGLAILPLASYAQQTTSANYQLLINGKPVDIEAGKEYTLPAPTGATFRVELREKEFRFFKDEWVAFQHPANLSVAQTQEEGVRQLVLLNASGAGVLIQEYAGLDPADALSLMQSSLIKDDLKAGYKVSEQPYTLTLADKKKVLGKRVTLAQKHEKKVYEIAAWTGENEGIMLITIQQQDGSADDATNKKMIDSILTTLVINR